MMRWWWFGPAVTKKELEREMRLMKEGGIGGFEVQATYPLLPDDPSSGIKNLPYLSDAFIDALRFTSTKAREFGLRMDLTLGSGWPYGGPSVPITDAAAMLRSERVKVQPNVRRITIPSITAGEKFLAAFLGRADGQSIVADSLRELADIHDGAVWLPSNLDASSEVLFFISSRTGMQVKRPAVGAEGYVLNHLDASASERYLKHVGDRLMQAFGANPPHAVFCDSLEVYNQDWTPDFLDEFKKRRGYELKPYLPALIADVGPKTLEIRHDWGKTLTELFNERFVAPLHDWAKRNHTLLRMQDYGVPAAALSSNAYIDLPEGEGAQWKVVRATRWASSASHIYGHQVTSSETWTWLHSPVFRATPLDMKAEADLHFLVGINQLVGHGWPYTPEGIEYPGWRFYAAAVFDEKNPWWIVMPDVALYLQRLSYLLRQGQPANDVALYLPNDDAWAHFTAGNTHLIEILRDRVGPDVIPAILESGYGLDFVDDEALRQLGRADIESFTLGANRYRVIVLPSVERIPPDTLRKLNAFARGGAYVIATRRRPEIAPGLQASEADQKEIRQTSQGLFDGVSGRGYFVGDEKALGDILAKHPGPDVSFSPAASQIGFIHRRTNDAEIYFLANTSHVSQDVKATFPQTGQPAVPAPIDLSTGWRVTFGDNAKPLVMDQLRSWTENEATKYFSGRATYEKEVNLPAGFLQPGITVKLDFGDAKPIPEQPLRSGMQTWLDGPVREAAVVYVNQRRAGSVWCPPYSLDVTSFLHPGENQIRILVANLALNYMSGRRLPDYRVLNLRYGERFQAQDMDKVQAVPAGLLGPIRLLVNRGSKP